MTRYVDLLLNRQWEGKIMLEASKMKSDYAESLLRQ